MIDTTGIKNESGMDDVLADELLAVRCQLGEAAALDALVARWHEPLWRYVRRMTGDDETTAELVQDIWLRVLRALPSLRDPSRVRAWLFGIARRAIMDGLRASYSTKATVDEDIESVPATEDPADLTEDLAAMHRGLAELPITERDVLVLFYLKELTLGQLAEVLSVPVGTVKSRLHRARSMLRRTLIQRGYAR
jgi:RNA polymerase sigma-70 factor (ECF subfamily)